jgi:predicted nucleotidyltransferase
MFKELNTLGLFFDFPSREFSVRELARLLKKAPATVSKELKGLSKKGLLKERKERGFNFYKAEIDSDFYKDMKLFYTTRKIRKSGLIEKLNEFYLKPTIVLFGSASQGMDTETSDIDIVVISEKTKEFPSKEFEKKLGREIQMFVVKNIKDLKNDHLVNNVLNGKVIQGEIKWI